MSFRTSQSNVPIVELLSPSVLGNKSSSNLKALPMSLNVVPHAVKPTKRSVPVAETTATVPSGKCFLPSTYAANTGLLLKTYMGQEYLACVLLEQGLHNLKKEITT